MLTEILEQRLKWLHKDKYKFSNQEVYVVETEESGKAEIRCLVNKNALCFNGDQIHLTFIKQQKSVDGVIFIFSDKNEMYLHLIECKTTVSRIEHTNSKHANRSWKAIKEKFEGSLLTAMALQGLLNLPKIQDVCCYTAFREDELTDRLKANLVDAEVEMFSKQEKNKDYNLGVDWLNDEITILSLNKIKHRKIELDKETGFGEIDLTI